MVVLEREAAAEVVIRKSRFIGRLLPVGSVDEADAAVAAVRETHKAANHNCFAYTIGIEGTLVERFSDDGEPSGTAGRPMLEILRRREVRNTVAVVTRYFGGTLLGAGGLVHAYQDAVLAALEAGTPLVCERRREATVTCDYGAFGRLLHAYMESGYAVGEKRFSDRVEVRVAVAEDEAASLLKMTADLTGGQAHVDLAEAAWVGVRPDGSWVAIHAT